MSPLSQKEWTNDNAPIKPQQTDILFIPCQQTGNLLILCSSDFRTCFLASVLTCACQYQLGPETGHIMVSQTLVNTLTVTGVLVLAQEKPRVGEDGRPLLNKPKVDLCKSRKYHEKYGNHHYFLSWREPWNKFEDWDWFNARNFCRERCMDLVSFEDPEEYRHFATLMHKGKYLEFMWNFCRVNLFQF